MGYPPGAPTDNFDAAIGDAGNCPETNLSYGKTYRGLGLCLTTADRSEDTNTIADPENTISFTSKIKGIKTSFTHEFAPYSINVVQIETL
ncbi:MAG: hypothetical protein ACXVAY_10280 [Mucilaginibacter sp.]